MRPGRIDRRLRYALATCAQARGLFERLFKDAEEDVHMGSSSVGDVLEEEDPGSGLGVSVDKGTGGVGVAPIVDEASGLHSEQTMPSPPAVDLSLASSKSKEAEAGPPQVLSDARLAELAQEFADSVRDYEFSPAELQGYLLLNRDQPVAAAKEMGAWVERQRVERELKAERKAQRREQRRAARAKMEAAARVNFQQPYVPGGLGGYPPFAPPFELPMGMSTRTPPLQSQPVLSTSPTPTPPPPGGDADAAAASPVVDEHHNDDEAPAVKTVVLASPPAYSLGCGEPTIETRC